MLSRRFTIGSAALGVAGILGLAAAPALAQSNKPKAPATAAPPGGHLDAQGNALPNLSGPQPDWVKLCSTDPQTNKSICQTSRDLRAETGQTLASVAVRQDQSGKRLLIMAIPPGMQIQPGIRVVVDQGAAVAGKYTVCFPNVCIAEAEASDSLIAALRKGTTLNLQALSVQAKGLVFPFQLAGFAKAYDGKPTDPKVFVDEQKKMQDELEKKAEEARKALDQQNGQAPAQ